MDAFEPVRAAARALRADITRDGRSRSSEQLVEAAAAKINLELHFLPPESPTLKGARALFDNQAGLICCANGGSPADRAALAAHELGHASLDGLSLSCNANDTDVGQPLEGAPLGLQRVEDYGQRERRELQANVFAREFLLPQDEARRLHLEKGLPADAIAGLLDLTPALVRQQLLDALMLPPATEPVAPVAEPRRPDPSQTRAAHHRRSPFLLQAGPGTGKTHALIQRVSWLLEEKVDPASVAIMTFSNRAAGELQERLAKAHPAAAANIWIGTLHAFGLDLIRRYHDRLSLSPDPTLFDRTDAIAMLEEELPTLQLEHHRDLWNPARELRNMLVAISRAKDWLVDPVRYHELAKAMLGAASSDEERERAERALEVASVYERYEAGLSESDAVDFGDLIMRPTRLLEQHEDLRMAVGTRHRHVLVDEYQDVNRASARLLKALAGDGARLWVVGDSRQAIYRFRGASSMNMRRFVVDFPGANTDQLAINYRSSAELVESFVHLARNMRASIGLLPLAFSSSRGRTGILPDIRHVQDPGAELEDLASRIQDLARTGVEFQQQAVLCRSNTKVTEVAAALEARGVPVLHLGSVFERDEIRDLLALLSLVVDRRGDGLLRVGCLPRYGMQLPDVQAALACLAPDAAPASSRLREAAANAPGLSPEGRAGLQRLADDLEGFTKGSSPWEVLTTYGLERTRLFAELATASSVVERMRAVAVWQFLNFAKQPVPGQGPLIRRLLSRVRMLVLLAEERDLRRVPAAALHVNAVRLMTVHAAKGLEFDAVHVPGMTVASFPASSQRDPCPPPTNMIEDDPDSEAAHDDEEECLFFVAASRARTHLVLYASGKQANGNKRNPSRFLKWLGGSATLPLIRARSDDPAAEALPVQIEWPRDYRVTGSGLEAYQRCPRRFLYTHLLGLGTARAPTAYTRTRDCLFRLIEWAAKERAARVVTETEVLAKLADIWAAQGPTDHGFASEYRAIAERLALNLMRSWKGYNFEEPRSFDLSIGPGLRLSIEPDELARSSSGDQVLRRVRPGYGRSDEDKRIEYRLLDLAGAELCEGHRVEAVHLTDDETQPIEFTAEKRRKTKEWVEAALMEILAGRLPPDVSTYNCPQCPHFFICPSLPGGSLCPRSAPAPKG